jgi:hypothetical protein
VLCRGVFTREESTARASRVIAGIPDAKSKIKVFFEEIPGIRVDFYLDQQMNHSHKMKEDIENIFNNSDIDFRIVVSEHVDACLANKEYFILCTSDSVIIDRTKNKIFNLSKAVLEKNYAVIIPDIRLLLLGNM